MINPGKEMSMLSMYSSRWDMGPWVLFRKTPLRQATCSDSDWRVLQSPNRIKFQQIRELILHLHFTPILDDNWLPSSEASTSSPTPSPRASRRCPRSPSTGSSPSPRGWRTSPHQSQELLNSILTSILILIQVHGEGPVLRQDGQEVPQPSRLRR